MTDQEKRKLRLSIAIISGRYTYADLDDKWLLIGYDPYMFSALGMPNMSEIKQKAEKYIAECIIRAIEHEKESV